MVRMGAAGKRMKKVIVGEHIKDVRETDAFGRERTVRNAVPFVKMGYGYNLGTLEKAREAFTKATKLEIDWNSGAPEAEDVEFQQAAE